MQKIKGKSLMIRIAGRTIALATSCQLSMTANIDETKTKDDAVGPAGEFESLSWTMSSDNIVGVNEELTTIQYTHLELARIMHSGEKVVVEFSPVADYEGAVPSGDWTAGNTLAVGTYSGKALIDNLSLTAPGEGDATLSVNFRGVGPLTIEGTNTIPPARPTES